MFPDKPVNPVLKQSMDQLGLQIIWDNPVISADIIIFHNPSFLKFNKSFDPKLVCQNLIVVTHENFLSPLGTLGFDITGCLEKIEAQTLCAGAYLAPVSDYNRQTVVDWLPPFSNWNVLPENWFNICDFEFQAPTAKPTDRRGRHSRPGFEKFPDRNTMEVLFPAHADSNTILGADAFSSDQIPPHWTLHNFRTVSVDKFLDQIDFFVYFTHPTWRESFGRVIAEATASGKLVITDPETAKIFGEGVVGTTPENVDQVISELIAAPKDYQKRVKQAQKQLKRFGAEAFADQAAAIISRMSYRGIRAAE